MTAARSRPRLLVGAGITLGLGVLVSSGLAIGGSGARGAIGRIDRRDPRLCRVRTRTKGLGF